MDEITEQQLKTLSSYTGIKEKYLNKYLNYFNYPYDKNERKLYVYNFLKDKNLKCSFKTFTFMINNLKTRNVKDLVMNGSGCKFEELFPTIFNQVEQDIEI